MSQACAMTSLRTRRMGGAPPLLVMNGRDNESSASGQAEGPGRRSYCLSSGSPLPMEFHSSSITVAN